MMENAMFVVTKKRDKLGRMRWRWNLVAKNHEVVASSEAYNSEASALKGVAAVVTLAADANVVYDYK